MVNSPKHQVNQYPSLVPSPKNYSSNISSSSSSITTTTTNNNNGLHHQDSQHNHPIPITRSEPNNPYPTTFVQADTSSFKQVVQMLTGSAEPTKTTRPESFKNPIPPIRNIPRKDKSVSKLYERRNSMKNFKISPLAPGFVHNKSGYSIRSLRPSTPEIVSPSILDFPSLALSPVTPLIPDLFNRSPLHAKPNLDLVAEDKAIAQKGFYLHPSPADTPRDFEPRLLPLFPVTSPRLSGSSESNS